jgi:hypothetical protein
MPHSVNPYLCPILGVRAHQTGARIDDWAFIVSLELEEQGVVSSILEYFLQRLAFLLEGVKRLLALNVIRAK